MMTYLLLRGAHSLSATRTTPHLLLSTPNAFVARQCCSSLRAFGVSYETLCSSLSRQTFTSRFGSCCLEMANCGPEDPCTLAFTASQSFAYREPTEPVIIVIGYSFCMGRTIQRRAKALHSDPHGKSERCVVREVTERLVFVMHVSRVHVHRRRWGTSFSVDVPHSVRRACPSP